ncbi:MAG TPA: [protein-PII] uridylyltransferase [Woeseiaceae bacterium]|nr:[protein-PII] uridylyltransferase [Woeseiaceae bacterium]
MARAPAAEPTRDDPAVAALKASLAADGGDVADCRAALAEAGARLTERFLRGEPVTELVRLRAEIVDRLLVFLWQQHAGGLADTVALVAVGGYGRGELHPASDVDIMLLLDDGVVAGAEPALAAFVASLWDVGLEIGHSVRTVEQCRAQAAADVTVTTTLMEARRLAGPERLLAALADAIAAGTIWPSDAFFTAKREEQQARHHRFDDTAYKLEPNVKSSPGGLRDIQIIGWIARRHFGIRRLDDLVRLKLLTRGQLRVLREGQAFLWRVRFGLHVLTGRREDRLLFDHQARLAEMLGYEDASYTLAVEQLMQRYYRTVMDLSRQNEMLLQLFEEAIFRDPDARPVPLNARFQVKNGYLQTVDDGVFKREPPALLELFLLLQQNEELRGVSAVTVGLIRRHLHLIDEEFRQNPRNHRLFLGILRAPAGVTHQLRRMNLYGVLGLYIPSFGRIVGRMQYDLFHAYTVDEHTLFVVGNLRRFALSRYDHEHPHCSPLMQSFEKPEIVYLAALFHDIAKGRGGDHSELGAVDAEAFCLEHGMSRYDARTVAWLVRHHLVLSTTAQKKDIADPAVINAFAALVGDKAHLDYLYVLTIADVRGTNPKLWNSWKATLFRDLYESTARALRRGLENPIDRDELIRETQSAARELLEQRGLPAARRRDVWRRFPEDYFLRYRSEEIVWHTEILAAPRGANETSRLELRRQPAGDGLEAFIYAPRTKRTFAHATAALDELGMNIVDARVVSIADGYSLDTYIFMELDRRIEADEARLDKIRRALARVIAAPGKRVEPVKRRAPRQVRLFSTRTRVEFDVDTANRRTVMELTAGDRPGLLSIVGQAFVDLALDIETAKVMTIGERAEDVFYIVDEHGNPLPAALCRELEERLTSTLGTEK